MKKLLRRWLGIETDSKLIDELIDCERNQRLRIEALEHREPFSVDKMVQTIDAYVYTKTDPIEERLAALETAQQGGMVFNGAGHWLSFKCSGCGFVCHTYLPDRELVIGGETIFGCPQCRHQTTLARDGHIVVGFDDRIEALEQVQRGEPSSDYQITRFIRNLTTVLPPAEAGRLEQRWFVNWVRRNLPKSDTGYDR